jgi:hypothetical protein
LSDLEHCPVCGSELQIIAAAMQAPGNQTHPPALAAPGPGTAVGIGSRPLARSCLMPAQRSGLRCVGARSIATGA